MNVRQFLLISLLAALIACARPACAQDYILDDAERFARLFQANADSLSEEVLQTEYLDPGTQGIHIFTPNRIENAGYLARYIATHRDLYQQAIDRCLPAARAAGAGVSEVLEHIRVMLGQDRSAPAYVVFGAGNSGGTASEDGFVIGLEVVCRSAKTPAEADRSIRGLVAHEIVHVYQQRIWTEDQRDLDRDFSLLEMALMEGVADFVAARANESAGLTDSLRAAYGMAHEAALWREFSEVMDTATYVPWMYGPGKDGRPSDLAYWIGKRIAEAYYARSADKEAALHDLLVLDDARRILQFSRYMQE